MFYLPKILTVGSSDTYFHVVINSNSEIIRYMTITEIIMKIIMIIITAYAIINALRLRSIA